MAVCHIGFLHEKSFIQWAQDETPKDENAVSNWTLGGLDGQYECATHECGGLWGAVVVLCSGTPGLKN